MTPDLQRLASPVISRIKVLNEFGHRERRVPQDGRFRVKYKAASLTFAFHLLPSHGRRRCTPCLDKETLSEKFHSLSLDVVGFSAGRMAPLPPLYSRTYRHGARYGLPLG